MAKKRVGDELLFHDKVVAAVDLPGVPAGTPGKVTLKNGFRWIRYRVMFDNGGDIGSLDRAQLALRDEWAQQQKANGQTAAPTSGDAAAAPVTPA